MAHGTRGWGGHWTWRGQEEGVRERTGGKDRPARREVKPARQARKVQRGGGSTARRPCGDTGRGRATRQQAGARGHPAHGADRAAVQLRLRHQEGPSLDGLRGRGQEGPEEGSEVLRGSEARERGGGGGGSGGSAHYVWGQTREKWKEERGWLKAEEIRQETS